jgi:hypothetical protein
VASLSSISDLFSIAASVVADAVFLLSGVTGRVIVKSVPAPGADSTLILPGHRPVEKEPLRRQVENAWGFPRGVSRPNPACIPWQCFLQ